MKIIISVIVLFTAMSVSAAETFFLYNQPACSKLTVTVNSDNRFPNINLRTDRRDDDCSVEIYCTDEQGNIQATCTGIRLHNTNYDERNGHTMYGCKCEHTVVCIQTDTAPVCSPVAKLKP